METALIVASFVFGLVALLHLVRVCKKVDILVANKPVPMWISQVGFIISLVLCVWMFMASKG